MLFSSETDLFGRARTKGKYERGDETRERQSGREGGGRGTNVGLHLWGTKKREGRQAWGDERGREEKEERAERDERRCWTRRRKDAGRGELIG